VPVGGQHPRALGALLRCTGGGGSRSRPAFPSLVGSSAAGGRAGGCGCSSSGPCGVTTRAGARRLTRVRFDLLTSERGAGCGERGAARLSGRPRRPGGAWKVRRAAKGGGKTSFASSRPARSRGRHGHAAGVVHCRGHSSSRGVRGRPSINQPTWQHAAEDKEGRERRQEGEWEEERLPLRESVARCCLAAARWCRRWAVPPGKPSGGRSRQRHAPVKPRAGHRAVRRRRRGSSRRRHDGHGARARARVRTG
jgi:hypothetical protein